MPDDCCMAAPLEQSGDAPKVRNYNMHIIIERKLKTEAKQCKSYWMNDYAMNITDTKLHEFKTILEAQP